MAPGEVFGCWVGLAGDSVAGHLAEPTVAVAPQRCARGPSAVLSVAAHAAAGGLSPHPSVLFPLAMLTAVAVPV